LFQGSADPELAQQLVLLERLDRRHGAEAHLPHVRLQPWRLVVQAEAPFLDPAV